MRFRQVHLDFHTSEKIEGIGEKFSKEQFQAALKLGHVDSITVFSKCHHGWAYHPSTANEIHPHLKFDLLKAQIDAANEIGVLTPIYISAGFDEKEARRHPEWLIRAKDESIAGVRTLAEPGYHKFCFNSPYLDRLLAQIKEVVENYETNGIFLDIVSVHTCYCQNCVNMLLSEGKDPYDEANARELAERVYANYAKRVREVLDEVNPNLRVFHNGGHIQRGRRDLANFNTHLELESLPTGGWGYDHFPLSASYAANLGMEYLGMTGKFHHSWGEFGGFKHPNALRYEVSLSAAFGARCSVGDQLHPSGEMDMATYRLIGEGYEQLIDMEKYLVDVTPVADVALLSCEGTGDVGASRILLEGHYLFSVIDDQVDFGKYRVIIVPDMELTAETVEKLRLYVEGGGQLLACAPCLINNDKFDFGARYVGEQLFSPDYFRPGFDIDVLSTADFVFYSRGVHIEVTTGQELGKRINPYFNRSTFSFCSHRHTPSSGEYGGGGMVKGKAGVYIAWDVFSEYAEKGSLILKKVVLHGLDVLLGDNKTVVTNLPSQGVTTMFRQKDSFIQHFLYVSPVRRGKDTEVIEDIVPVLNTTVSLRTDRPVRSIKCGEGELDFVQDGDIVRYTIPRFELGCIVVID